MNLGLKDRCQCIHAMPDPLELLGGAGELTRAMALYSLLLRRPSAGAPLAAALDACVDLFFCPSLAR